MGIPPCDTVRQDILCRLESSHGPFSQGAEDAVGL